MKISKQYEAIDEAMHEYRHKSGFKAYVIPKRGYSQKFAAITTKFGSIDNKFIIPGEEKATGVPDGVAHFLEHKLFEQKDGSVMDKFAALGASPNAYTTFNLTSYHFTTIENFTENLKLLLEFVQNPYLTDESVEREKEIIGQEIRMYEDNPNWKVFFNLLRAFYKSNPVRINIAGSIDSIRSIDRQTLYTCHSAFYHPSNMILIVVGDVDEEEVFELVDKQFGETEQNEEIRRVYPERETAVAENYVEQAMAVSSPIFQLGFMEPGEVEKGENMIMYESAVKIIQDMILGRGSRLYERLYSEGLINNSFDMDCNIEENYAFSIFGGESPDPARLRDVVADFLQKGVKESLDEQDFERKRRAMTGRFIKQLNFIDKIAHGFISVYYKGAFIFDYFDVYDKITFGYVNDVFRRHFNISNMALSVIKPL